MGFLDSVTVPQGATPTVKTPNQPASGSFLDSVKTPTAAETAQASHVSSLRNRDQVDKANSDYANSVPGLAVSTLKGLWDASGIPEQYASGQAQIDQAQIDRANTPPGKYTQLDRAEGVLAQGAGVVTKLTAPAAPILKYIGHGVTVAGNALAQTPYMQGFGRDTASLPGKTAPEHLLEDIANISAVAGVAAGGVEGVKGSFEPAVRGGFLESTKIPVKSESVESNIPIKTPEAAKPHASTPHAEYARSQGYEPYTPHDQLPTIQTGPKGTSKLPTINIGHGIERPMPTPPGTKLEPIKEPAPTASTRAVEAPKPTVNIGRGVVRPAPTPRVEPSIAERASVPSEARTTESVSASPASLKPVESTGELRTPELSSSVASKAVARNLRESLGDLPQYNKTDWETQGIRAVKVATDHPDVALRVALGEEAPPEGVLASAVFKAVEDNATRTGDSATISQLANSKLASATVRMGQEIGYLSQRDELSPVRIVQNLAKDRATRSARASSALLENGRRAARPIPSVDKLSDFIKSIECGY